MKKQTVSKIEFLLVGILARLKENTEFFEEIEFLYKSGTKSFQGKVNFENEKFVVRFNGVSRIVDSDALERAILNGAENYESVLITYYERGACIELEGSDRKVSHRQVQNKPQREKERKANVINQGNRDYFIKIGEADKLLLEIGILTKEGKLKNDMIRKYNQIDHFIELAKPVIESLGRKKKIYVLDCACGKSYLSFVLNYYMRDVLKLDCSFIGVDIKQGVVDSSEKMAKNLGYNNMKFVCADMNSYTPPVKIDLLISLHACDTATDMSLGLGIRSGVGAIICVPCCHKEMLSMYNYEPFAPLTDFPVFKARLADTLTDAMRALYLKARGYDVTALEYISPLETPKNLMIKAIKKSDGDETAMEQYRMLSDSLGVYLSIEAYSEEITEDE